MLSSLGIKAAFDAERCSGNTGYNTGCTQVQSYRHAAACAGDNEHVALKYQFTWDGMPLDGASVLSMVKLSQDGTMIESWTDAPEHFAKVGEPVIMGMRPLLQGFDSFRQNLPPGLVDSLPDDMAKWLRRK